MTVSYIPLAQTSTATPWTPEDYDALAKPPRPSRRRTIIGAALVIVLLAFYLFVESTVTDDDDLDYSRIVLEYGEYGPVYIPFELANLNQSSSTARLTPTQVLPDHCRDAYMSTGALCFDPYIKPMDVVWTWVNGSDPLLQEAKWRAESKFSGDDPYRPHSSSQQERQYRDNDELRHSMRSVLESFRPYTRHFHLITSDFPMPSNSSFPDGWKLGQVPQWLNMDEPWEDRDVELSLIRHAEIFKPYSGASFNSYAIESQFANLPNVSEIFVYMNDDFFMSNPLTQRSFYTSAYGVVLRFDLGISIAPTVGSADDPGEWRSMRHTNVLLSDRFGARHRPYVLHVGKGVPLPLLQEIALMWHDELAEVASHPFRETEAGYGDVSMLFMLSHFIVERWREALLWSWVIAKHGSLRDEWSESTMKRAWADLGGQDGVPEVDVQAVWRGTVEDRRVTSYLKASGHIRSDNTQYRFSSWDGYPYAFVDENVHQWPSFQPDVAEESLPSCTIKMEECFMDDGARISSASEVFKNIAFRKPKCGDCVSQALVSASGFLGLEAFLPSSERELPIFDQEHLAGDDVPHLPLTHRWQDAQFSLLSIMVGSQETNVRAWTLQLLQRYRFVIAYTPYIFVMLVDRDNTRGALDWIDHDREASMLGINDDMKVGEEEAAEYFVSWQERRWHKPAAWERFD